MKLDIRSALERARKVLVAVAPITPIRTDDASILLIDAILKDADLFGYVESKVSAADSGTLSLEDEPTEAVLEGLWSGDHNFSWGQFAAMLPTIIELVRLFRS